MSSNAASLDDGSLNGSEAGSENGSGPGGPGGPGQEEGDHLINWHLGYISQLLMQGENYLNTLASQIKAELVKIRTDSDFIQDKLPKPHHHLIKLKQADKDLRRQLEPIKELAKSLEKTAQKTARRI